jgi:ADP-ribose pyrophosphatase
MAGDAPLPVPLPMGSCAPPLPVAISPAVWYSVEPMHGRDARSDRDDQLQWEERSRTRVASCSLFELFASQRSSPRGKTGEFSILTAPDWVNVVPVLRGAAGEDCFLMVRQYRHGAGIVTTEFPAGLVEPGEEPLHAAARELEEETGFRAGRMTLLGHVSPNPAFMTNWCFTFLAEDLSRVGEASLDALEELDALTIPVAEVQERIGTGELVNSLTLAAFLLHERRGAAGSGNAARSCGDGVL